MFLSTYIYMHPNKTNMCFSMFDTTEIEINIIIMELKIEKELYRETRKEEKKANGSGN